MHITRQVRGFGWLIALVGAAVAVVTFRARRMPALAPDYPIAMDVDSGPPQAGDHGTAPPVREIDIEMAAPSIWPVAAGLGVTLGFAGVVTSPYVGLVGVIVLIAALAGWIGEMVREHNR